MKKWIAMLAILAMMLTLTLTACGGGEEKTVTGMVMSVDGTVVSLMDMGGFGGRGEMPERPEGMEDFTRPENGEDFQKPEGMEDFTMPENFDPENFDPEKMEGFGQGEGPMMPPNGEMPDRENFGEMGEPTTLDLANAHISIEIDGGKESGSMENIVPGTMVTVTVDGKGNATHVLVSQSFGFSFGGFEMK